MDQFAAERYAQKLCIRYVSGRRNRRFFCFSNFYEPCNHPNLYAVIILGLRIVRPSVTVSPNPRASSLVSGNGTKDRACHQHTCHVLLSVNSVKRSPVARPKKRRQTECDPRRREPAYLRSAVLPLPQHQRYQNKLGSPREPCLRTSRPRMT